VIDEARDIPAHACIPHPSAIQFKTPDVSFLQILVLTRETLFLGDLLTRVVDDLRASLDLSLCKYTPTVNL